MLLLRVAADTALRLAIAVGIGLAVLYLLSFVALPDCDCYRQPRAIQAGGRACLSMLRSAQQQFMQEARLDRDGDGVGEAGTFEQLTHVVSPQQPLLASGRFVRDEHGLVHRNQYYLQIYLPTLDGSWTTDLAKADPDRSEHGYRMCAWPDGSSDMVLHAFWLDGTGEGWYCANGDHRYRGAEKPLGARDGEPDPATLMSQPEQRVGRDRQVWKRWF